MGDVCLLRTREENHTMKQRSLRLVENENRFAGLEPEELNES